MNKKSLPIKKLRKSLQSLSFSILSLFCISYGFSQEIHFEPATGTPFPNVSDGALAFADVNGDGALDVLITGRANAPTTHLYLNDGEGNFTEVQNSGISNSYFGTVNFFDANNNGSPDLLLTGVGSDENPMAEFYLNDGEGNFTLVENSGIEAVGASAVAVADVNGDGFIDFIASGMANSNQLEIMLYLNDGNGNFTPQPNTPFEAVWYASMEFADVDGDGDEDLLIIGEKFGSTFAQLYLNDGEGNFTPQPNTPFFGLSTSSFAFADLNGNGALDVIVTGFDESDILYATLFVNDGEGNFTIDESTPFEGLYDGTVIFADVDNDGDMDVVITGGDLDWNPHTHLYINDGEGNFEESSFVFDNFYRNSGAFADVNGDGKMDLLLSGFKDNQKATILYLNESTLDATSFHRENWSLFPNPSEGIFYLNNSEPSEKETDLVVYSPLGQIIQKLKWNGHSLKIDLTSYPAGIYFVRIDQSDQTFKLIKN